MSHVPQSLNGLRVLNTRPQPQGSLLSQAINDSGGIAIDLPALAIMPINNWIEQLPPLEHIDQAIFISANAVTFFFQQLKQKHILWPNAINVVAVGHSTAATLKKLGFSSITIPAKADSEGLLDLACLQNVKNQTILHVKGEGGRTLLAKVLQARKANLLSASVYRRELPDIPPSKIDHLWQENGIDIILFTSEQAIHNLFVLFGSQKREWLSKTFCLVISKRLAEVATKKGMQNIICCNYDEIIQTLFEHAGSCKSASCR